MQSRITGRLVLVVGLGLTLAACGKYSINSLRASQAFQNATEKYQKGDYQGAIPDYEHVIQLSPDFGVGPFAYFFLGNSYDNLYKPAKKGDPENDGYLTKAVDNYKLAVEKLSTSPDPRAPNIRKLAFEYLIAAYGTDKLDDLDKALPIAQELIALEPNEPTNYQALGKLYEDAGRYDEAEAAFKKAIEVKPNDALSYETLAGYYDRQGDFDKKIQALETRAEMEPNDPEAWHQMGPYYSGEVMKDFKLSNADALKYVMRGLEVEDKALSLNPEYFEAMAYKNILLRQEARLIKDPAKQKELLKEADDVRAKSIELQKAQQAAANAK